MVSMQVSTTLAGVTMTAEFWYWLFLSEDGLLARIACGAAFFAILAIADIIRKGSQAQRWREYLFLLAVVPAAMAYGIINDQITATISWEYIYNHDASITAALGPDTPPDEAALRWQAFKLAAKATWSAGLLIAAFLLIANNPGKKRLPQLSYGRLYLMLRWPLMCALAMAAILGILGYFGAFASMFEDVCKYTDWRPARFMAVWGIHLGGYAGGAIGTIIAVLTIRNKRRKAAA